MSQVISARSRIPLATQRAPNGATIGAFNRAIVPSALGAASINLPSPVSEGTVCQISDNDGAGGVANANPITVNGNGLLIDGAASLVISTANAEVTLIVDGGQWRRVLTARTFDNDAEAHHRTSEI